VLEIAIHIQPAERPFNGVHIAVLIAIKFQEVILRQLANLRILDYGGTVIRAGIVASGVFQDAMNQQVGLGFHDGFP